MADREIKFTGFPKAADSLPEPPASKSIGAAAARTIGSIIGSRVATVPSPLTTIGGGLIGGAGETIAELIENGYDPRKLSPSRIGMETVLTGIPGGWLLSPGKKLASAVKGLVIAEAGNIGRRWASGKQTSASDLVSDIPSAAAGTLIGAAAGHLTSPIKRGDRPMPVDTGKPHGPTGPSPEYLADKVVTENTKTNPPMTKYERQSVPPVVEDESRLPKGQPRPVTDAIKARKAATAAKDTFGDVVQQGRNEKAATTFEQGVAGETVKQEARIGKEAERQAVKDQKALDEQAAAIRVQKEKEGLVPKKTSVKETAKSTQDGATTTVTTTFGSAKAKEKGAPSVTPATPPVLPVVPKKGSTPRNKDTFDNRVNEVLAKIGEKPVGPSGSTQDPNTTIAPGATNTVAAVEAARERALERRITYAQDRVYGGQRSTDLPERRGPSVGPVTDGLRTGDKPLGPQDRRAGQVALNTVVGERKGDIPVPKSFEPFFRVAPGEGSTPPLKSAVVPPEGTGPVGQRSALPGAGKPPVGAANPVMEHPRVTALKQQLEALPDNHPAIDVIKRELDLAGEYSRLKALAEGKPKGSPEWAAARKAGVEASTSRVQTDQALSKMPVPEGMRQPEPPAAPKPVVSKVTDTPVAGPAKGVAQTDAARKAAGDPAVRARATATRKANAMVKKDAGLMRRLMEMSPEDRRAALADLAKKFVKSDEGSAMPLLGLDPAMAVKLGLTAAGAATGYYTDPLGDPIASAVVGGGAGYGLGHLAGGKVNAGVESPTGKSIDQMVRNFANKIPNFQRSNYLSGGDSLLANSIAGPVGGGILGSIEQILKGKFAGGQYEAQAIEALKHIANPAKFGREYLNALERADKILINSADKERAGQFLTGVIDWADPKSLAKHAFELPAVLMTGGDETIRKFLMDAGIPEELARQITLTSEPAWVFSRQLMKQARIDKQTGKASWGIAMMFPFRRTALNILEQGVTRTPFVGALARYINKQPASWQNQLVEQGMGAAVFMASEQIGENVDPENAKTIRRFVSNLGGPYALLSNAGFNAGQIARKSGESAFQGGLGMLDVLSTVGKATIQRDVPMPSTDVLTDYWSAADNLLKGNPAGKSPIDMLPRGFRPGATMPETWGLAKGSPLPQPQNLIPGLENFTFER